MRPKIAGLGEIEYRLEPTLGAISHICDNMAMARRQTLIQLDDARIAALDERAAASGRSRSDLIREAVDLLLGTGDAAAIDAAIVAGYRRHPPPKRDSWVWNAAIASIREEPW
jgi:hypothetical protein